MIKFVYDMSSRFKIWFNSMASTSDVSWHTATTTSCEWAFSESLVNSNVLKWRRPVQRPDKICQFEKRMSSTQCDQIYRNFAIMAKHIACDFGKFLMVLCNIWQNFEPTLANVLCYVANFNCCKRPKILWLSSRLVTLISVC